MLPVTFLSVTFLSVPQIYEYGPWREKICLRVCEQQSRRPAAHSCRLISPFVICFLESIISKPSYKQNFHFRVSLCSWAGWFGYELFGNPEYNTMVHWGPYLVQVNEKSFVYTGQNPRNLNWCARTCLFAGTVTCVCCIMWVWRCDIYWSGAPSVSSEWYQDVPGNGNYTQVDTT